MIELENNRRYLNQWELNQRIIIDGFLVGTRVEFSMLYDCKDSALPVSAYEEGSHVYADIPNILLQNFGLLRVSVRPSANDLDHVQQEKILKIVRQEKPDDYVYTETRTFSYEALREQVGELEKSIQSGEAVPDEKIQKAVDEYIDENPITIQPATEERLGGFKLGENLTITDEGVLSSETDEDDFVEITNLEVEQIIKNIGGF